MFAGSLEFPNLGTGVLWTDTGLSQNGLHNQREGVHDDDGDDGDGPHERQAIHLSAQG